MSMLFRALLGTAIALPAVAHNGVAHEPALAPAAGAQIRQFSEAVARYRDFAVAEREGWSMAGIKGRACRAQHGGNGSPLIRVTPLRADDGGRR